MKRPNAAPCRAAACLLAVWLGWGGVASANDFARRGVYVGVAGLIAGYPGYEDRIADALAEAGTSATVQVENTVGVELKLGYRLHPRLAAEIEAEFLPDARVFVDGAPLAEQRAWAVGANARVFAFTGRFQPFVLAGIGAAGGELRASVAETSASAFAGRFGGGLDVYATEHVLFSVDITYALPTGDLGGIDVFSFAWGMQYRF